MAFVGHSRYVVVALHVGGSKASDIKLVLQREPRFGKTWFSTSSILPNEEHADDGVRELHEEMGLMRTLDDLTLFSDAPVRVAIPGGQQHVYVFSAYVQVPYVMTHLRTPGRLEQDVTVQSTINLDGSYIVPETIDIDGLSRTPAQQGLLQALKREYELLHFGYVTQWDTFRRAAYTHQVLCYDDTSIPRQFLMYPRFTSIDSGRVWMLIRGHINQLCGHTTTDLRMGAPFPTTNFVGLPVTLTETQRKAAINSKFQFGCEPRELEDWLEAQPQLFVLLGITGDSYDAVRYMGYFTVFWTPEQLIVER
jgi:ADP-ribose pyrophosphatase YjhB (NUDIX family)